MPDTTNSASEKPIKGPGSQGGRTGGRTNIRWSDDEMAVLLRKCSAGVDLTSWCRATLLEEPTKRSRAKPGPSEKALAHLTHELNALGSHLKASPVAEFAPTLDQLCGVLNQISALYGFEDAPGGYRDRQG